MGASFSPYDLDRLYWTINCALTYPFENAQRNLDMNQARSLERMKLELRDAYDPAARWTSRTESGPSVPVQ